MELHISIIPETIAHIRGIPVAFGQAKYYTDNLRENILRGIRQKIRCGELSAKAPLGYFNEPRLRTIEPDKKTFAKVKECLGAFATGEYTLTAIYREFLLKISKLISPPFQHVSLASQTLT